MNFKTYTLTGFLIFFTSLTQAQVDYHDAQSLRNEEPHEQCAHTIIHERMMAENPVYRAEQEEQEESIQQLALQYEQGLIPKANGIYTIPVVVHIIHKGEAYGTGTNIVDAQVYSAIQALNEDYRKMAGTNGDGDGVDIEVEFCLAQRDPNDNPHSGINRVSGCSVTNYCDQGITAGQGSGAHEMTVKNLSRWPNQEYYNIWVVSEIENNNGGSGIQGYAYFPTTSQVDGTVLLYNAFGTVGNLKSYTNMNRTLTHELGHAFRLYHTFQGGSCDDETACTMQGDRVCDTPPTTLNSNCSNPACEGTQQVNNYLDYTSQTCKNMFTEGQKARMRQAIVEARSNLMNSNGCEPIESTPADAAITEISSPEGNTCSNIINPVIKLTNAGSVPFSSALIEYRTDGAWQPYSWSGLLGPGQTTSITLPAFNGGWGIKTFEAKVSNPNGIGDSNNANNLLTKSYHAVNDGYTITVDITTDLLGAQTTWLIRDESNNTLASGGPYVNFQNGVVYSHDVCVTDGCYELVVMDAAGNGMCCNNGNGGYVLSDENGNELAAGGSFGSSEISAFCLNESGTPPQADFSASQTTVCAGESITFTNLSTGDVDTYEWKFFGGTPFTVTSQNPGSITYNTPGIYNVRLAVTNAFGTDVEIKSNYITVVENNIFYADADGDGHGDPNNTVLACNPPTGYVTNSDDCDDTNGSTWNECYDCAGVMNGPASMDNCGTCDTNTNNDCTQDCAGVWGGTASMDNCGTCDTNTNNDCTQDCAGTWGGNAAMDNCGSCDSNPSNDCQQDCAGVWGGNASLDNCGTCDTNPSNNCTQDCAGNWGGSAYEDNCGTCDTNPNNDCVQDCAGVWGGDAILDNCGTCDNNPNNNCTEDCMGVDGGSAYVDNCGVCDDNPSNDCVQDCAGVWGGSAYEDNCGTCDNNANNDCNLDCLGNWGGNAVLDNCGVCDTNSANDCVQDCAGIWGGTASEDNCGTCDNNPANDCIQDCAGVWGGSASTDNCGTCDNNPSNDCEQDCAGVWGGNSYEDECGTCDNNPANDCVPCEGLTITLVESINPNCFEGNDGSITIGVESETGIYEVFWNTGDMSTLSISGLGAGEYQVAVIEDTCIEYMLFTISDPAPLTASLAAITHIPCESEEFGSASIAVNGGTPPYQFTLNENPVADLSFDNLSAGIYEVLITDANYCTLSMWFEIEQQTCGDLPITGLFSRHCNTSSNSFFNAVYCTPVEGAESYEWHFESTMDTSAVFTLNTDSFKIYAVEIPQIVPGVVYQVWVRAVHPELDSQYGESCFIDFAVRSSHLVEDDCGNINLQQDAPITCIPVEAAQEFEFRFENTVTMERAYHYSASNTTAALETVDGLEVDVIYNVQIRSKYREVWGNYGPSCDIKMASVIPTTKLIDVWCENYAIDTENDVILVEPIPSATVYELRLSGGDLINPIYIQHNQLEFSAGEFADLTKGMAYVANVRAFANNQWTPWGADCEIAFVEEDMYKLNLHVYPNPVFRNDEISLLMKGDWQNVQLSIYNLTGEQVHSITLSVKHEVPHKITIPGLKSGIYMINAIHAKESLTKKIIVQ